MAIKNIYGQSLLKPIGYNVTQNETSIILHLIQEYMQHGTMQDVLNDQSKYERISLYDKFRVILDLIRGIVRLHHKKLIHRDIKPDNIFFSNNQTKLGDFGVSMINKKGELNNNVGNMIYLPIEYMMNDYDEKIDVYSYGLIVNVVFTNR